MAGHLGNAARCQQNLEVFRVDSDRSLLLVRGSVPGPAGGRLIVVPSVKQKKG
jgi:large subunit ribosomal protein L3